MRGWLITFGFIGLMAVVAGVSTLRTGSSSPPVAAGTSSPAPPTASATPTVDLKAAIATIEAEVGYPFKTRTPRPAPPPVIIQVPPVIIPPPPTDVPYPPAPLHCTTYNGRDLICR